MKKRSLCLFAVAACVALVMVAPAAAQSFTKMPQEITTPDKTETRIGTLEFTNGVPSAYTASKVYDTLLFTRALNVYNNSFRGASALALVGAFRASEPTLTTSSFSPS